MGQCINAGAKQYQSTDPADTQADESQALLDDGCQGNFTHVKSGTQWWYQNLLIKEEATVQTISIADDGYGYEWYEDDGFGTCTRMTSKISNNDPLLNPLIFVEYQLTTSTYIKELGDWVEPL